MASSTSDPGACANENNQEVIKIDPDGDLTLVVGKIKTRFLVCSKALSRSSRFWKRCLYGPFREAKPAAGWDWVVEFPEDNPSGLHYLLLLVHGLGHRLPQINLQLAFEITVLTNKYDMTQSLWAVGGSWLEHLKPIRPDESDDDTIVPQLQWLWVTKELGDCSGHSETFAELTQMVSMTAEGDAHLLLRPYQPGDAKALTRDNLEGYDAEKDVIFLLTDEIEEAREEALSAIQNVLRKDMKKLRDAIRTFDSSKGCSGAVICVGMKSSLTDLRPAKQRLCEYAMQAIVAKLSAGKYSAVKPIAKVDMSVEDYLAHVVCFTSQVEREIVLVLGHQHNNCTPFTSKLPSLRTLKAQTLRNWSNENSAAFKMRAQASGLGKGVDAANGPDSSARKRSREDFEAASSA